jgi:cytochrome bd-type quinol oxidase subunit 2
MSWRMSSVYGRPAAESTPKVHASVGDKTSPKQRMFATLPYGAVGISLFPYVVPPDITLRDAAAAPQSQAFLLVGTLFLLPIVLMYTGWSYWVFRGKVRGDVGYH